MPHYYYYGFLTQFYYYDASTVPPIRITCVIASNTMTCLLWSYISNEVSKNVYLMIWRFFERLSYRMNDFI